MTSRVFSTSLFLLLLTTFTVVDSTHAQWIANGTPLNAELGVQSFPAIVSDGSGGAIVCWSDSRHGPGTADIYAQRIDSMGRLQWKLDGVPICSAAGLQGGVQVVSDGATGAIVVWADTRSGTPNSDIYAQRVDGNGSVLWSLNGIPACVGSGVHTLSLVTDAAGGAIVVWEDDRTGTVDLFAQRIDPSGNVLWAANGVAACTNPSLKGYSTAASDEAGGVLLVWSDSRNVSTEPDVYAQRIGASGLAEWNSAGVEICTAVKFQWNACIVSDGVNGAFVAWEDCRTDPLGECMFSDIFAQRVNFDGTIEWPVNGIRLTTTLESDSNPSISSDGAGGAIICWDRDYSDVYAQRMGPTGSLIWPPNGVPVAMGSATQYDNQIISDGVGGAIVAWKDDVPSVNDDIYANRISAGGLLLWGTAGMAISTAPGEQHRSVLTSDGWGGAFLAWQDNRNGINTDDIYVQRVTGAGAIPTAVRHTSPSPFVLSECTPNPFSTSTTMRLTLDRPSSVSINLYDAAGRHVSMSQVSFGAGNHKLEFDGTDGRGGRLPSGVYFARVTAGTATQSRKLIIVR